MKYASPQPAADVQFVARGRPRSDHATEAVLRAAYALLHERGYAALTIEGVAERAGVGKATVYRRWPDRAGLAVGAFFACTQAQLSLPDTGLARDDFRGQIHALADLLRGPAGEALAGMIAGGRTDPVLRRAVGERWVAPRREWGRARMDRALADGECRPGIDRDAALSALYGPLYWPLMLGRGVEPRAQLDAVLDIVLAGIFRA